MKKTDLQAITEEISRGTTKTGRGIQTPPTEEERTTRAAELRTQGRKNCKAVRINMAFTPDNHRFIKIMARATGNTMTEFTNLVIEKYREEHPELYSTVQELITNL